MTSVYTPIEATIFSAINKSETGDPAPPAAAEAFTIVMRTTGASETVTLPLAGFAGSNDVDWGDGSSVETVSSQNPTHVYAVADDYTIEITGSGAGQFSFNNGGDRLKLREIVAWGTDFDVSLLNFRGCSNLQTADNLGTSGAALTNISRLFEGCSSVTAVDVSGLDTSSVTNMLGAFQFCTALASINGLADLDVTGLAGTDLNNLLNGANNALSTAEYNAVLVGWEAQAVNNSLAPHFGDATYDGAGATARAALIADHSWTITDGGPA